METMKPTVGKIVLFHKNLAGAKPSDAQAALIVEVHDDGMLTLVAWKHNGGQGTELRIPLVESGEGVTGPYCVWPEDR